MTTSAPGKIILLGEHAVVYGKPAIAIPVASVSTSVTISDHLGGLFVRSTALALDSELNDLPPKHPIRAMFEVIFTQLEIQPKQLLVEVSSSIPVASGLGSGAALSAAAIQAFAEKFNIKLSLEQVNAICFETEKIFHGNPSGVDNTVITYNRPVYYHPGKTVQPLQISGEFHFIIANTGIQASTKDVVADVRYLTETDPGAMNTIDRIGELVDRGRIAIQKGDNTALGKLMDEAHLELKDLQVSCPELDALVRTAKELNALGAKLSGAGRGGNMIVLSKAEDVKTISAGLLNAGAKNIISMSLRGA